MTCQGNHKQIHSAQQSRRQVGRLPGRDAAAVRPPGRQYSLVHDPHVLHAPAAAGRAAEGQAREVVDLFGREGGAAYGTRRRRVGHRGMFQSWGTGLASSNAGSSAAAAACKARWSPRPLTRTKQPRTPARLLQMRQPKLCTPEGRRLWGSSGGGGSGRYVHVSALAALGYCCPQQGGQQRQASKRFKQALLPNALPTGRHANGAHPRRRAGPPRLSGCQGRSSRRAETVAPAVLARSRRGRAWPRTRRLRL